MNTSVKLFVVFIVFLFAFSSFFVVGIFVGLNIERINQNNFSKIEENSEIIENNNTYISDEDQNNNFLIIPKEWIEIDIPEIRTSFAFPNQDFYKAIESSKIPEVFDKYMWVYQLDQLNPYDIFTDPKLLVLGYLPDGISRKQFPCGIGCIEESLIQITIADKISIDEVMKHLLEKSDNMSGEFSKIINYNKIEYKNYPAYKYQMTEGIENPAGDYYLIETDNYIYMISSLFGNNNDLNLIFDSITFY